MEFKAEDQIQWVAGFYSFLDYGERNDIFRTGPDSVFNQAAIAVSDTIKRKPQMVCFMMLRPNAFGNWT